MLIKIVGSLVCIQTKVCEADGDDGQDASSGCQGEPPFSSFFSPV